MHEKAILQIDQAALALIQALSTHKEEMQRYLGPRQMATLEGELISLRRMLLGLEMGVLYQDWEPPEEVIDSLTRITWNECMSVREVVAKAAELLDKPLKGDE